VSDTQKTYVAPVLNKLHDVSDSTARACGDVVTCSKQIITSTKVKNAESCFPLSELAGDPALSLYILRLF
jgi:hypothetical protein